jgi:hypothetical protein
MVQRLCRCWSIIITSSRGLLSCGGMEQHQFCRVATQVETLLTSGHAQRMHPSRIVRVEDLQPEGSTSVFFLSSFSLPWRIYADLCGASTACHALHQPRNPGAYITIVLHS